MAFSAAASTSASQQVIVSPFPAPPEFAAAYTRDRIASGQILPPPPVPSDYIVFGEEFHLEDEIIRSLGSQKITQLFSNKNDWKSEMKKLNRSAVAAFLDLLDILIRCPDSNERREKLNSISTIFINMHHLINEYRPLQARDTLIALQKMQIKRVQDITTKFRSSIEKGREALKLLMDESADSVLLEVPPLQQSEEAMVKAQHTSFQKVSPVMTGEQKQRRKCERSLLKALDAM